MGEVTGNRILRAIFGGEGPRENERRYNANSQLRRIADTAEPWTVEGLRDEVRRWLYGTENYDDYDEEESWECSWCGGDAWEECTDWIQCTYRGCDGEMHPCSACQGTGDGRKQTVF